MTTDEKTRATELIATNERTDAQHQELIDLHNKYCLPQATYSRCGGCVQKAIKRLNEKINEPEKTETK